MYLKIWYLVVGEDANKVISLFFSRSQTSYECHWSALILVGNDEKIISFSLLIEKSIDIAIALSIVIAIDGKV